ncbi:MAG: hypothetical protein J5778_02685 [Clostridiales bacterium]|nr:hypothetical protein [Clostridiales bacterium]
MDMKYDDIFGEYFNLELEKIPKVFRFFNTKKKILWGITIMCLLLVITFAFVTLYYSSQETTTFETKSGYIQSYVTYNNLLLIPVIISAVLTAAESLWLELSWFFERLAFRKATKFAHIAYRYERETAWRRNHFSDFYEKDK